MYAQSLVIAAFAVTLAFSRGMTPCSAQVVIDDTPIAGSDVLTQAPIIGYRDFPTDALVLLDPKKNKWVMDAAVVYDAAAHDVDFIRQNQMTTDEIKSLAPKDLVTMYQKIVRENKRTKCQGLTQFRPQVWRNAILCSGENDHITQITQDSHLQGKLVNTQFVRLAFEKNAISKRDVQLVHFTGHQDRPTVGITVDSQFARTAATVYGTLERLASSTTEPSNVVEIGNATQAAMKNAAVAQVSAVLLTTVTIGKPLVLRAQEKGLEIEPSIARLYDVYWLQLAMNPSEDLRKKVSELSFFVSLKTKDSIALELAPLRYGQEKTVKEERSLEPKAEIAHLTVSAGKIFSQEIAYKTLKPTVIGTGLQASNFGWSLSDEMVDMSAKRLIAVIGVPKGAASLDLEMVASARTVSRGFSFQGGLASTEPISFSADLRRR